MICCLNPYCHEPLNPDGQAACQSCGTPLIPLLRDRFKVIEPIGRGGFGKTYIAQDIDKLNERCIIKQLAYQARNKEEAEKVQQLFELEAQQLQQLGEHPQIPALFAYFQSNNYFFLAQQLIDGQNLLREFEQDGAFNFSKSRYILQNLLPVLQYVHDSHVIHRDIKPENIIRQSGTGKLVLIDFGVSKVVAPTAQTQTGTTIGSHGYVSPEQSKGRAKPCSDLFSLGATCFHMLSGIDPSELWAEKGYAWVDEWQKYLPYAIDSQFAYVLNRLLAKDYLQRYQSASEALRDLQSVPQPGIASNITTRTTAAGNAVTQVSSYKNSSVRTARSTEAELSPTSHTRVTKVSKSTYVRQPTLLDVVRDNPLARSPAFLGAGLGVVVVGVAGVSMLLSRSPIPATQTPVTPLPQTIPSQQVPPSQVYPPPPRGGQPPGYPPPPRGGQPPGFPPPRGGQPPGDPPPQQ